LLLCCFFWHKIAEITRLQKQLLEWINLAALHATLSRT